MHQFPASQAKVSNNPGTRVDNFANMRIKNFKNLLSMWPWFRDSPIDVIRNHTLPSQKSALQPSDIPLPQADPHILLRTAPAADDILMALVWVISLKRCQWEHPCVQKNGMRPCFCEQQKGYTHAHIDRCIPLYIYIDRWFIHYTKKAFRHTMSYTQMYQQHSITIWNIFVYIYTHVWYGIVWYGMVWYVCIYHYISYMCFNKNAQRIRCILPLLTRQNCGKYTNISGWAKLVGQSETERLGSTWYIALWLASDIHTLVLQIPCEKVQMDLTNNPNHTIFEGGYGAPGGYG